MPKIVWVLAPLALYAALLAVAAARRRLPSRQAFNVHTSLLLMVYLLTTASLGIFWVANQQLPVFDWHYLFGYCTVLLVSIHLYFNLPLAWRWLRGPQRGRATSPGPSPATALTIAGALVAAFLLGTRERAGVAAPLPAADAMTRYHELSSDSRRSVFARAPGIDWGAPPPAFKTYPAAVHVPLPRGEVGTAALGDALRGARPRTAPLGLAELGDILFLAAGVTARRGGNALRASPSSGALFSSELYVLARAIDGLAAGAWRYDPDLHRLDFVGKAPAVSSAPDGDAVIVATSIFRRTGYKYRDRAYRYVTADTGHLLENLRLAGQAAGMQAEAAARFDETELAHIVGVDGVEEGVLAVMALRRGAARAREPRFAAAGDDGGMALGVTGAVQQATSLRLADMAQAPQLSGAIRAHVVVNRVDGVAPGVYRYLARHALERVRAGDFGGAAQSAALSQEVIGNAAVVLVLSAERAPMLGEGARGYRHGYLEAGMMGERWLLGAVARGLAACPVGAFYDDEAAALIGVDPKRQWVLHFAALGVPAS